MNRRTNVDNVLNSEIDPALVDESKVVDLVLEPGDVSVHQPNIIHGSNANNSAQAPRGADHPADPDDHAHPPQPGAVALRAAAARRRGG